MRFKLLLYYEFDSIFDLFTNKYESMITYLAYQNDNYVSSGQHVAVFVSKLEYIQMHLLIIIHQLNYLHLISIN